MTHKRRGLPGGGSGTRLMGLQKVMVGRGGREREEMTYWGKGGS